MISLVDRNFLDPQAHYLLAEHYHSQGLWDKALYQLDLALRFGPYFRKAQLAKIRILLETGDTQAADRAVDSFIKQSQHSPELLVELAVCLQEEGLDRYALDCLNRAAALFPRTPLVFKQLGLYYLAKDQQAKARENLIRSLELDPTQADVAGTLGRLGVVVEVPSPSTAPSVTADSPPQM